jgi:hypothetical protein
VGHVREGAGRSSEWACNNSSAMPITANNHAITRTSDKISIRTIVRRDYKCNKPPCNGRNAHCSRRRLPDLAHLLYHCGRSLSRRGAVTASSGLVLVTFRRQQQQYDRYGHGVVYVGRSSIRDFVQNRTIMLTYTWNMGACRPHVALCSPLHSPAFSP